MATSYTSLLGLALPVTGELAGTWGDTVNNSITSLVDTAVAGTTTLSSDADVTLTTTSGASNQARQAIIVCSGARTALRTITAPAQSKVYVVVNNTTGGYGVKIVGAGPTTGVTVANGKTTTIAWNGSDFVEVSPATATNLSGGLAGSVPYQSGANTTTFLSIGTANQVLQVNSGATAPEWVSSTGTGNVVRATSPTIATPTITTSATAPLIIGGTGTTSTLTLRSTSGVGTTGADIILQVGNNGATEAMRVLNSGNVGIGTASPAQKLDVNGDALIYGVRVGRGAGAVATNTAVGASALNANVTGTDNVAVGYRAGYNSIGVGNTYIGDSAGYTNNTAGNTFNTFVGYYSGYYTTGVSNTFLGEESGNAITSGGKNTILGRYSGNQDGLDIRTASNYAVISDGDGNRLLSMYNGGTLALDGGAVPQAGTGITFPDTQSASSNGNTLDDYEEGTFTPTVVGASSAGTGTYSIQVGRYVKIGKLVTVQVYMAWSAHTGTGNMRFGALPFSSVNTTNAYSGVAIGWCQNIALTANNVITAAVIPNTTSIDVYQYPVGGGGATAVPIDTSGEIIYTVSYETAN